jgi:hypothetical protein
VNRNLDDVAVVLLVERDVDRQASDRALGASVPRLMLEHELLAHLRQYSIEVVQVGGSLYAAACAAYRADLNHARFQRDLLTLVSRTREAEASLPLCLPFRGARLLAAARVHGVPRLGRAQ